MDSNSVIIIRETAEYGPAIFGAFVTGLFLLLAAYIAYKCGLGTYFRRREHEQIIRRYLDEGIDRVLAGVNQAQRVFIDNHLKALKTLRQVEEGQKVNIPVMFETCGRHILESTPYNKINYLIGDQVFGLFIALFLGIIDGQSEVLEKEFQQLHHIITEKGTQATLSPDLTVEEVRVSLNVSYKKTEKCFLLTDELQQLASILEKQTTLSWPALSQFKNLPEVKQSVKRLKKIYAELKAQSQQPTKNNN